MKTGMLWFDNDPKTDLQTKINKAAHYYQNKYGQIPNLCFVHPSMLGQTEAVGLTANQAQPNTRIKLDKLPQGLDIRSSTKVLPNHLWLGIRNNEPVPVI